MQVDEGGMPGESPPKGTRLPAVRGMVSVRDESWIIEDTLDSWPCDEVYLYMDAPPEFHIDHPKIKECVLSTLYDPDRQRAEWYKRQLLFNSLSRFCENNDWICLFDADEHLDHFRPEILTDLSIACIHCISWDFYITPEDEDKPYQERDWVSPKFRRLPFFIRWDPRLTWHRPNQHNPDRDKTMGETVIHGSVKHWGPGYSVENYERKRDYYVREWPIYKERWEGREAVKRDYKDDFGRPLIRYSEIEHV